MTRAVVAHALGAPESFVLEDIELPTPGPGHVRVAVRAAALSFVDVLVAEGGYQLKPPTPFVPGSEMAGVIESVGEGVDPSRIGERVFSFRFGGALAEATNIAADQIAPAPVDFSDAEAAAFSISYRTAYHGLVDRGRLQPGESVLVLGAAGSVGIAGVQLAKALGAGMIIAAVSNDEKRAVAKASGATHFLDSRSKTFRDDLRAITPAVNVVFDPVGGDLLEPAFRHLRWNGRHLVIGFAGGPIPKLPVNLALLKGAALVGVDTRQFGEREPAAARKNIDALFALLAAGHPLRPPIAKTYALSEFAAAMREAKSGTAAGRIVVKMT